METSRRNGNPGGGLWKEVRPLSQPAADSSPRGGAEGLCGVPSLETPPGGRATERLHSQEAATALMVETLRPVGELRRAAQWRRLAGVFLSDRAAGREE